MVITIKEIQDYWNRYCERHGLKPKIVAEGMRQIKLNPDYWADHTMAELQDVATSKAERPKPKPRSALLRRGIA